MQESKVKISNGGRKKADKRVSLYQDSSATEGDDVGRTSFKRVTRQMTAMTAAKQGNHMDAVESEI